MSIQTVSTQAVSATSTLNTFLAKEMSAEGVSGRVPYALLTDGNTLSGTAMVQIVGSLPPIAISGTAFVHVTNQLDASVHGQISAFITNQIDASVHGQVSAYITNQIDVSAHGFVSAHITNTPTIIAHNATNTVYDGTTALTPKYANVAVNTAGAEVVIAKVAAKKLRILSMVLVSEGANGIYFDGGKDMFGTSTNPMEFGANGGVVLGYNPVGWQETSSSAAFSIIPDTATSVAGTITYVEV